MNIDEQSTLKEIERLFIKYGQPNPLTMQFKCSDCGTDVELEFHKTAHGYGMNGGVLFINSDDQLLIKCLDCHKSTFETPTGNIR